mgnify:FL=1
MKQTYVLPVRLPEELARQLAVMSAAEGRTPEAQFLLMLRNNIAYFQRSRGKFDPAKIREADLSPFEIITK